MKGKYKIVIQNNVVRYEVEVKRNVTIIKGDSGTGKTIFFGLVDMLSDPNEYGAEKGFYCNCPDMLVALNIRDWERTLELSGKIIVIDEHFSMLSTKEFASRMKSSDNYFIIISRLRYKNFGYSVNSIYGFKSYKRGYLTTTRLYSKYVDSVEKVYPDVIITEDEKSGFEMFKLLSKSLGKDCLVVSAKGNSKVFDTVKKYNKDNNVLYVVVDGAAYGSYMDSLVSYLNLYGDNVYVFFPESFEYLILATRYYSKYLSGELTRTEDYCDSVRYFTWENYYTSLLKDLCVNRYKFKYNKHALHSAFKGNAFIEEFKKQIPDLF